MVAFPQNRPWSHPPDTAVILGEDRGSPSRGLGTAVASGRLPVMAPVTPTLTAAGLRRAFGDRLAVDDVSLQIAPGEAYGLLGPNGAGKTTTINLLLGLLDRDAGTVAVAGTDLDTDPAGAKAAIGYVPQEIALYPDLTARENLQFFGRLQGLDRATIATRSAEALDLIGLADRADERIETYSGGMKRRINIAAGLLHRPALLILDEPTVGVDPQSRNAILDGVAALNDEGLAILYTSHYMEEVERLCQRVGIIDHGRLIAEGTQRELVTSIGTRDRVDLVLDGDTAAARDAVAAMAGVQEVALAADPDRGATTLTALTDDARSALPALLQVVADAGGAVTSVEVVEPNLEAVFLHLTGRALRD